MNLPRLILDINVLLPAVSGQPTSPERRLWNKFRRGQLGIVFSDALITEFLEVLRYPEVQALGITPAVSGMLVYDLFLLGDYYSPQEMTVLDWPTLGDKKDWYLLDLLFTSRADGLITRDKKVIVAGKKLAMPVVHPDALEQRGWL
ncbi:MAG: hypothetical protein U5L04_01005 [Trueperaceae bacterium]|nr:hypothetical protein [Trueperaceae bacterium]